MSTYRVNRELSDMAELHAKSGNGGAVLEPDGPYGLPRFILQLFPNRKAFEASLACFLFVVTFWTFFPAVHNGFINYDDPDYVSANSHVQQGFTWQSIKWAFSNTETGNWHPLTWLSHMLDCELFGLDPRGHHLTSVLLHAINVVLVFLVFRKMTGRVGTSFCLAALFGLHPLRVESVAWISERKDVLSTAFWMLTLFAYANFVRDGVSTAKRRSWYWLSVGFFCLGLLSKSMLVTVPCVLLLLDYWPLRRWQSGRERSILFEKVPFFLLTIVLCVVTFVAQRDRGAVAWSSHTSIGTRFENAIVSYGRYLGKLFVPIDLSVFYPRPSRWPAEILMLCGCLVVLMTVLAIVARRRCAYVGVGWFWFLGTLVPVIGIIQVGIQSMADRYSYVPSIGALVIVVWGINNLLKGWRAWLPMASTGFVCILFACFYGTRRQLGYWKNSETLFRHAVEVTSNNFIAHNNLGIALEKQGHFDEALEHYDIALRINPDYAEMYNNIGVILDREGKLDEAIARYQKALKLRPDYLDAHVNLGVALSERGDFDPALAECTRAIELKPDYAAAYYQLGVVYGRMGKYDDAIQAFRKVLKLQPAYADAHYSLGVTFFKQGAVDDAAREYNEALKLDPNNVDAHFNLGFIRANQNRVEEAIHEYREVLRVEPNHERAATNLKILLEIQQARSRDPSSIMR